MIKHARMHRWGLVSGTTRVSFVMLTACICCVEAWAVGEAAKGGARPMTTTPTGEPYELAGKRIVFANWYYVRPGSFAWVDDKGNGVTVVGSQGPWGAHFRRHDYPHGIRLAAQPAQRIGPIIDFERPWEGMGVNIGTLIHHEGKYKGWGGSQAKDGKKYACYFESKDGRT